MQDGLPLTRDLVLIGGGHAHALVLRAWGMNPLPGARLTVIDPNPAAPYTGMLPGFVAGHYSRGELEIDLVRLARFAGARLVPARAVGIDRERRHIHVEAAGPERAPIPYDVASIDVGITSAMPEMPGFAEHAVAAKPLGAFAARWTEFLGQGGGDVAVIGGGVAGCELAMAMTHSLNGRGRVTVIEGETALPGTSRDGRRAILRAMDRLGVTLIESVTVDAIGPSGPQLANGGAIAAALTVGAAGARPYSWIADLGLPVTGGFLDVDARLGTADPRIFGAGDCVHLTHAPRVKAGVYAVRAAPILHTNLRAVLRGTEPTDRFDPQKDYLKLISLGGRAALADRSGTVWGEGPIAAKALWRLKDRIDRKFMARLTDLPAMKPAALPIRAADGAREMVHGRPMPCGGCGAKVGSATLSSALGTLPPGTRGDIETAAGDDAAVLRVGGMRQVLTTDHLRAFTEDPWVLGRIAALHAMGDVLAMGAAPQAALAQIVLPRMGDRLQAETLRETLHAAAAAFAEAGAEIVGGHTTEGPEAITGFAVTGLLDRPAIALEGARPGDRLLLTRAIGSGTVLAGEMAMAADGADVIATLREMGTAQVPLARRLAERATAMTDVTGFGLAGHLAALCRASGTGAEVALDAVPLLPGALGLADAGVRSSLFESNAAAKVERPAGPRADLMFDPQTAGGFLAAWPRGQPIPDGATEIGEITATGPVRFA